MGANPGWASFTLFAILKSSLANHEDRHRIHRLQKEYQALRGRSTTCLSGWSLCPASVGGDCCPNNYACAESYCYATTAGPKTACGKAGYFACGNDSPGTWLSRPWIDFKANDVRLGLCCPTDYVCRKDGFCVPPAGATLTCSSNAYLCASSLNGGCCPSGMGCNLNGCYSTVPSTYTITSGVATTNSAGSTITSVLTYTTTKTPSATISKTSADAVVGYKQSTVSKIAAIETSPSSGGLNQAQLGGVIGGVVAILIAIVVAAFLIIRRLRKNAKLIEESKLGTSAANETIVSYKPGGTGVVTTTVTEVDMSNDIDPLMLEPRINRPAHLRAPSDSSVEGRQPSPARSPGLSSGQSTPPAWPGQYNPVPNPDNGVRHTSIDSAPEAYYDAARQSEVSRSSYNRTSYDSQVSNPHSRHWSYVSEVSGSADGAHGISELETSDAAGRRRSSSGATRPVAAHIRRTSDPHQRGRSDSSAPMVGSLGTLSEINELHGYYGPPDRQTGQIAARLRLGESPIGHSSSE